MNRIFFTSRTTTYRSAVVLASLLILSGSLGLQAQQEPSSLRPLVVDDLFRYEQIKGGTFSPDGNWLAYAIVRPQGNTYRRDGLDGADRSDVWLVPAKGGTPRNLTNGVADGTGYSSPLWSPTGRYLMMLTTKDSLVRVCLWDRVSDQVRTITDLSVREWFRGQYAAWASEHQILANLLHKSTQPQLTKETQSAWVAMGAWPRAWAGNEPTASVLESGLFTSRVEGTLGELQLIDVRTGAKQVIGSGDISSPLLSPDKKSVAFLKFDAALQRAFSEQTPVTELAWNRYRLAISSIAGENISPQKLTNVVMGNPRRYPFIWSPDSKELVVIASLGDDKSGSKRLVRVNIAEQSVDFEGCKGLEPSDVIWAGPKLLAVRGAKRQENSSIASDLEPRNDWWSLDAKGQCRNLTSALRKAPNNLQIEEPGVSFLAVVGGDLWRASISNSDFPKNLTEGTAPEVRSIVEQSGEARSGKRQYLILRLDRSDATTDLYRFDPASGGITPIFKPSPDARLIDYQADEGAASFTAEGRTGSYLWLSKLGSQRFVSVVEANTYWRGIASPEAKRVDYRGEDGQRLIGWVILPNGYQPGKRYPLITFVHAGQTFDETLPSGLDRFTGSMWMQMLAAHGYAVLRPSMPLAPYGKASDPYLDLSKGVLPAVDRVIEMGIADPQRLGLMGHSFGGYSTYSLITQTTRFKAAVAIAGLTNLVSLYGVFEAGNRYDDSYHISQQVMLAEEGQVRMGAPLWKDYDRYRRNSPINYVGRVETPILMIHGDMDFVAIQQAEEFFTALERQGKRARFVRYWGEGHEPGSPANIRDMWQRIYDWFDEWLRAPPRDDRMNEAKK